MQWFRTLETTLLRGAVTNSNINYKMRSKERRITSKYEETQPFCSPLSAMATNFWSQVEDILILHHFQRRPLGWYRGEEYESFSKSYYVVSHRNLKICKPIKKNIIVKLWRMKKNLFKGKVWRRAIFSSFPWVKLEVLS